MEVIVAGDQEREALDRAWELVRLRDHLTDEDPIGALDEKIDPLREALRALGYRKIETPRSPIVGGIAQRDIAAGEVIVLPMVEFCALPRRLP